MKENCRVGDIVRSSRFAVGRRRTEHPNRVRLGVPGGYMGQSVYFPPDRVYMVGGLYTISPHENFVRLWPLAQDGDGWRFDPHDADVYVFSQNRHCPKRIDPSEIELLGHLTFEQIRR